MDGNINRKCVAIVLAGGRGSRMESNIPKQYMTVGNYPLIYYSLKVFEDSFIDEIVLVCAQADESYVKKEIVEKYNFKKIVKIVPGGKERYHSVFNGLDAIDSCDIVFIHDGARPFITEDILTKVLEETIEFGATVVAVPSKDTVKICDEDGFSVSTPNRNSVYIIQTPQTFIYDEIYKAYYELIERENELINKGISITDDAMVMEHFGNRKVKIVSGSYKNIKITTPEDIVLAETYINQVK